MCAFFLTSRVTQRDAGIVGWMFWAAGSSCALATWTALAVSVVASGLAVYWEPGPRMIPAWCSSPGPGLPWGRARGRPCRALGDDLGPGTGCPRRAHPAGRGRRPGHPGARSGTWGADRDADPGPRRHPDPRGRGSRRSPCPPCPGPVSPPGRRTLRQGCGHRCPGWRVPATSRPGGRRGSPLADAAAVCWREMRDGAGCAVPDQARRRRRRRGPDRR